MRGRPDGTPVFSVHAAPSPNRSRYLSGISSMERRMRSLLRRSIFREVRWFSIFDAASSMEAAVS